MAGNIYAPTGDPWKTAAERALADLCLAFAKPATLPMCRIGLAANQSLPVQLGACSITRYS